jgi:hypothetical protein
MRRACTRSCAAEPARFQHRACGGRGLAVAPDGIGGRLPGRWAAPLAAADSPAPSGHSCGGSAVREAADADPGRLGTAMPAAPARTDHSGLADEGAEDTSNCTAPTFEHVCAAPTSCTQYLRSRPPGSTASCTGSDPAARSDMVPRAQRTIRLPGRRLVPESLAAGCGSLGTGPEFP